MPDPSETGNPSVFSYNTSPLVFTLPLLNAYNRNSNDQHFHDLTQLSTASIPFYRGPQDNTFHTDEVAPDGCCKGYLFAFKSNNDEIMLLRMKVPLTFIDSDSPDLIYGQYDCEEFTISSNLNYGSQTLDFLSINGRMMNNVKDEDGYVYVFFAPYDYVQALVL